MVFILFFYSLSEGLLGITEAEERQKMQDFYLFITDFVKKLNRDALLGPAAMIFLHKFFKKQSLKHHGAQLFIAAAAVFLAAKVRYCPVSL